MTVIDCIGEYVDQAKERIPIFTNEIYNYVKQKLPNVKKNLFNEYITRYAKANPKFVRHKKGIYYKTVVTPFGIAGISYPDLIKKVYLTNGDNVIGYESGPSYMNKIGLTTQIPSYTYIVTERAKYAVLDESDKILLLKPVIKVNNENYRYLQFLDMLDNKMKIKIEAKNPNLILRGYIDRYGLNFERLLGFARQYKNNKIYPQLAELAEGVNV